MLPLMPKRMLMTMQPRKNRPLPSRRRQPRLKSRLKIRAQRLLEAKALRPQRLPPSWRRTIKSS